MQEINAARHPGKTLLSWGAVLVALLLCGAILAWRGQSRARETQMAAGATRTPEPVLTVETVQARQTVIPDVVEATGTVGARDPLEIAATVSGLKVEQVLVEQGDLVYPGQPLVVLDRSLLDTQLAQAQARLRSGGAQVAKAVQPNRVQDIERLRAALAEARATATQEQANLQQAQATAHFAQETAERYRKTLESGFVTVQENADKEQALAQSRASVRAARNRYRATQSAVSQAAKQLELAQAGGRAEDVEIARAGSQEMAGQVNQIEVQIDQTVVKAPDAGRILSRTVHLGEISSAGKTMFKLARRDELELNAEVAQTHLVKLHAGLPAVVSFNQHKVKGHVWQVSPEVNEQTRMGTARILLDKGSVLRPGMLAKARIDAGRHSALTLPASAVLGEGGDYYVFVLDGKTAKRRSVITGVRTSDLVEIVSGLKASEDVVANGGSQLNDGDRVDRKP